MRFVRILGVISCCLVVLSACAQGQSSDRRAARPTATTAPPLPGGYGLVASNPTLTDRIDLTTTRIQSGHSINGALIVVNHGTEPINLTDPCSPEFAVALTNSRYVPSWPSPPDARTTPSWSNPGPIDCPWTWPPPTLGAARLTRPSPSRSAPRPDPLRFPTGTYDAVLIGFGLRLPEPQPVAATLTS